jgi:hypothetical protein
MSAIVWRTTATDADIATLASSSADIDFADFALKCVILRPIISHFPRTNAAPRLNDYP